MLISDYALGKFREEIKIYPIEKIATSDRADHWAHSLGEVCGGFSTISRDWSKFRGNIELRNIGGFDVAGISMNAQKVTRSRKQIADGDDKYCFMIMQRQGRAVLSQRNSQAFLEPGDMALIDSGYPSEFVYDGDMDQISLHIPRETLESFLPYGRIEVATTIPGNVGMGAVVRDFLISTFHHAAHMEEQDNPTIRTALLNFLSATIRGHSPAQAENKKARQLSHIRKAIEQNLRDPALSPTMIARLCDMSTRQLHRLFQADGVPFGGWVRRRRLAEARRQLANNHFSDHSIIQIAFHWGFNDAAHFSRSFRQEFGQSPKQYRQSNIM